MHAGVQTAVMVNDKQARGQGHEGPASFLLGTTWTIPHSLTVTKGQAEASVISAKPDSPLQQTHSPLSHKGVTLGNTPQLKPHTLISGSASRDAKLQH